MGRIDKMIQEEILSLIELISPHGKDYVGEGFKNKTVEILYSMFTEENKGTFIKVDNEDCCIFYAAFLKEDNIEEALFDSAYYKLNLDNGWNLNSYASNEAMFNKKLTNLNSLNAVCSFWLKDELVGAYLLHQNYITDIVIKPKFQNKGYGHHILAHCLRNMMVNKSINNIRLRVAKSNTGAKRLYESTGFVTIASFAEHTYN